MQRRLCLCFGDWSSRCPKPPLVRHYHGVCSCYFSYCIFTLGLKSYKDSPRNFSSKQLAYALKIPLMWCCTQSGSWMWTHGVQNSKLDCKDFSRKNNGHSLSLTLLKFKTSWDYYGSTRMNYNLIAEERINLLEALLFFNSWVSLPYLDTSVQSPQVTINSNTPEEYHDLI